MTPKQRKFADAYLSCLNATQAAKEAGYSEKTAYSIGSENLRKPEIADYISKRFQESAMSADEALMHIGEIARGNLGPGFFFVERTITVLDKDRQAVEVTDIGLDWDKVEKFGRLIKSISFTANGPKIELYDRLKALEDIGRHHGSFTDRVDITTGGKPLIDLGRDGNDGPSQD